MTNQNQNQNQNKSNPQAGTKGTNEFDVQVAQATATNGHDVEIAKAKSAATNEHDVQVAKVGHENKKLEAELERMKIEADHELKKFKEEQENKNKKLSTMINAGQSIVISGMLTGLVLTTLKWTLDAEKHKIEFGNQ